MSFFRQALLSGDDSEQRAILKQQVAASMYLHLPISETDLMTVTEFRIVNEVADELRKEASEGGGLLPPGVMGSGRVL